MRPERTDRIAGVARDVRATREISPVAGSSMAEGVYGRYRRWLAVERPLDTAVRENPSPEHHWHAENAVEISPRLRMELVFAGREPVSADQAPTAGGSVRTILERIERIETVHSARQLETGQAAQPAPRAMPAALAVQPVERVVQSARRVEPHAPRPERAEREESTSRSYSKEDWSPRPARPAPIPDSEMARVAEHVIRAIDRRSIAQRERMGRR